MNLELHATPEEVMRAVEALEAFGREHRVGDRALHGLALALEECASNIVNHACRRDARQVFHVAFEHTASTVTLELRDRGPAFDPTRAPARMPQPDDDDRPEGGWGIQLVRRFTDEMHYVRANGENILRLVKRLDPVG